MSDEELLGASSGPGSSAFGTEATACLRPSGDDPSRDYVNEFFRAHYPADFDNREPDWCSGGVEQRYRGSSGSTIFPLMICADGLELSVQGHFGAYSYPRGDFEDAYSQVEIMAQPGITELAEYEHGYNATGDEMIYPYVPIGIVNALIAGRGGLVAQAIEARSGETRGAGLDPKDESAVASAMRPNTPSTTTVETLVKALEDLLRAFDPDEQNDAERQARSALTSYRSELGGKSDG
jgi:hypothetical protein